MLHSYSLFRQQCHALYSMQLYNDNKGIRFYSVVQKQQWDEERKKHIWTKNHQKHRPYIDVSLIFGCRAVLVDLRVKVRLYSAYL